MDINKILKEELAALDKVLAEDAELTDREKELIYGSCLGFAFNVSNSVNEQIKKDHAHTVCKCRNGAVVATTVCECGKHDHKVAKPAAVRTGGKKEQFAAKPLQLTTPRLAKAIGQNVRTVSCYAYRHGLGVIDPKRRVRVFNQEDAEAVTNHFKVNTKKEK